MSRLHHRVGRVVPVALIGLLSQIIVGGTAMPRPTQVAPQVGIPGCPDDVAVRASRESITFESQGRTIRALLYSPRGQANGFGMVLLHGGTGFEMNSILFDAHAIQLASRGYWVILPAYFDAAEPDQRRRLVTGRAWRQAALDAAAHLTARAGMPTDRVALWGYSRGAGVAADATTASASGVHAAVLVAGGGTFGESLAGRDLSFLMLHARRDEAVPVRSTLGLAEDLREAGAVVEVEALDFDGHQYDLSTWCVVMARTRTFLEGRLAP